MNCRTSALRIGILKAPSVILPIFVLGVLSGCLPKIQINGISDPALDAGTQNHIPVAVAQTLTVDDNATLAVTLAGTDEDGDSLNYSLISSGVDETHTAHGVLSGTAPDLLYTPTAPFSGVDNFSFTVNDGTVDSANATVSITVTHVNHAPVATAQSGLTVNGNATLAITLAATDADTGDVLNYSIVSGPSHGTLAGTAPHLVYTPTTPYQGADSFLFMVNDGQVDSAPASISITVTPELDTTAPTVTGLSNDSTPQQSKTWTWACSENCTYRYAVDTSSSWTASGAFDTSTTTTQISGDGTYYVHVQAKDSAGNLSAVVTGSAILDNTPPALTSVAVQTGLTVDVTFSEAMGSAVTTAANYSVSGSGKGSLSNNPNSVALVSENVYRLTWTSGEMFNGGDITIAVASATDIAGNAISSNATHTGGAIGTPPAIPLLGLNSPASSPGSDSTPTFEITLVGGGNFQSSDTITLYSLAACAGASVGTTSGVSAATASVTASAQAEGATTYSAKVTDDAGHATCSSMTNSYTFDSTLPSKLVFNSNSPSALSKNICSHAFTIQLQNSASIAANLSYNLTIALSENGAGSAEFFSTPYCTGSAVTEATIPSNINSVAIYIKHDTAENVTFTSSGGNGSGLTNATRAVAVSAALDTWTGSTFTGVPSGRYAHSAVWTGTEMIIWGGTPSTNTGARYNPATNTWGTATSTISAPAARSQHSAVWTGSEMIIWGGNNGSNLNTGGRYNPATDTWGTATSTSSVPTARYGHSAVWTGSEMIIWGGNTGTDQNTGGRYNPATDTWGTATSTTSAPTARRLQTAVWTGSQMIVWGGIDGVGTKQNTGGRYNPATDTWGTATSTASAPAARCQHSAVWTGSEMIIWGGSSTTDTGGRYNPTTNTWGTATSTTSAPSARYHHSAIWTGSEMIIWGGYIGFGPYINTGGRYNPTTNTWGTATSTISAPAARSQHSAVWTQSEMIIWGGYDGSGILNTGGRYNPVTDTWGTATSTTSAPAGRRWHTAIWTGSEMIIWGGYDGSSYLNTGARYNPAADTWGAATSTTSAAFARCLHSAVWTGTEMIVWGGYSMSNFPTQAGGRYNPATNTWGTATSMTNVPTARRWHSAIWTGSEMIVWGGHNDTTYLNTGGRYNPTLNTWGIATSTTSAPAARGQHSAVWTGSEMIIWGGSNGTSLNTGARYNPLADTWGTATSTTSAPNARSFHSAVWTGSEMIVWGGIEGSSSQNTGALFVP